MIHINSLTVKRKDFEMKSPTAHELLTAIVELYKLHDHDVPMPMVKRTDLEEVIARRLLRQFLKDVKQVNKYAELLILEAPDEEEDIFKILVPCPIGTELVLDIGFLEPLSKINKQGALLLAKKIAVTFHDAGFLSLDNVYDDGELELEPEEKKPYAEFRKGMNKWAKIMDTNSLRVADIFFKFKEKKSKKKNEILKLYDRINELDNGLPLIPERFDMEFGIAPETYGLVWNIGEFSEESPLPQDRVAYFNIVNGFYYSNNSDQIGKAYCPFCGDAEMLGDICDNLLLYEKLCLEWKDLTSSLLT